MTVQEPDGKCPGQQPCDGACLHVQAHDIGQTTHMSKSRSELRIRGDCVSNRLFYIGDVCVSRYVRLVIIGQKKRVFLFLPTKSLLFGKITCFFGKTLEFLGITEKNISNNPVRWAFLKEYFQNNPLHKRELDSTLSFHMMQMHILVFGYERLLEIVKSEIEQELYSCIREWLKMVSRKNCQVVMG